jgi:hypothetical protein
MDLCRLTSRILKTEAPRRAGQETAPQAVRADRLAERCRYCCKSPKLPGDNFPAIRRSDRGPAIFVASIRLPRTTVSFSSDDEAPHIFTRKSRLQPGEFLIISAKRLLQQYLPKPVVSRRSKQCSYSITSSARESRVGGTLRASVLAVLRLITNSNLVDCMIGNSAGFSPLRMRPA